MRATLRLNSKAEPKRAEVRWGTMIGGRGPNGPLSTRAGPGIRAQAQAPSPPQVPAPAPSPRRRSWPRFSPLRLVAALAVVVVLAVVAGFVVTNLRISGRPAVGENQVNAIVNQKVQTAISQLQAQPPPAVTAYGSIRLGFVVIESKHAAATGAAGGEDLGSGVIIDTRGDILTALHVVAGASRIEVSFYDGTTATASIKATDPSDDIAVLTASELPRVIAPAVLGSDPQVGDEVFAVGNPLGLDGSLTAGVVSGLDRTFRLADGRTLSGMIQFDAAVNPGSSGGPLLNTQGQVIGIVEGLANPAGTDNFAGIGFAVPIETAGQAAGAPPK
jgi:S1-C subfamily serine protease